MSLNSSLEFIALLNIENEKKMYSGIFPFFLQISYLAHHIFSDILSLSQPPGMSIALATKPMKTYPRQIQHQRTWHWCRPSWLSSLVPLPQRIRQRRRRGVADGNGQRTMPLSHPTQWWKSLLSISLDLEQATRCVCVCEWASERASEWVSERERENDNCFLALQCIHCVHSHQMAVCRMPS